MIAELIAGGVGLAAVAGLAVYAIRSVRVYADRALVEADARRAADVAAANLSADLRIADANTAAAKAQAQRERLRGDALERIARDRSLAVSPVLLDDAAGDRHGVDVLFAALDAAAGHADVRAGDGGAAGAAGDRLRADRGADPAVGGGDDPGPATVPGA